MGTKARPFYRVIVAKSSAGRDGAFVEIIGTYNPTLKNKLINIDQEKALQWLLSGAQPTETVAFLLKKAGVLDQFFAQRPKAKASYKFLDKRTAVMSTKSVIEAPVAAAAAPEPAPAPAPEPTPEPEPVAEAPAAEEAPVAAEEAPAETPEA